MAGVAVSVAEAVVDSVVVAVASAVVVAQGVLPAGITAHRVNRSGKPKRVSPFIESRTGKTRERLFSFSGGGRRTASGAVCYA